MGRRVILAIFSLVLGAISCSDGVAPGPEYVEPESKNFSCYIQNAAAQLMKRLGCSDAMTVEDLCWAPVILQDGGEHGNDLFKTYRRYDLRGNGAYRDIEFENLVTLCIK